MRAAALSIVLTCVVTACSEPTGTRAANTPLAAEAPASSASCGGAGELECPLRAWMRSTLQAYVLSATPDTERLAASLDKLADAAPSELPQWRTFAGRAAEAARKGDVGDVKKSCAECHTAYRAQFKATMRTRRLF